MSCALCVLLGVFLAFVIRRFIQWMTYTNNRD